MNRTFPQSFQIYYRAFRYERLDTRINLKYAGFTSFEFICAVGWSHTRIVEKIGLPIKEDLPCIW